MDQSVTATTAQSLVHSQRVQRHIAAKDYEEKKRVSFLLHC